MIKKYSFNYDSGKAFAMFNVDTSDFTPEAAKATLEFFTWDYDEEADPIDEVMKKYALEAIREATFNSHNTKGVIGDFEGKEGFANIDGSMGVLLTYIESFEFQEADLEMKVINIKKH